MTSQRSQFGRRMIISVILKIIFFLKIMCESSQAEILQMSLSDEPYLNRYVYNLSFTSILPCGFIQCQKQCLLKSRCLSINYDRHQLECILNVALATSNVRNTSDKSNGRIYKDIEHMKTDVKLVEFIGNCKDHVCPKNSKCIVLSSQRPHCIQDKSEDLQEGSRVQEWIFENIYECYNTLGNGVDYDGLVNVTKYGTPCQMWNSNTPHSHRFDDIVQDKNYCRNPDYGTKPWCYTTYPDIRFGYCDIPACETRRFEWKGCFFTDNGTDYVGPMRYTADGYYCKRWDLLYPNVHKFNNILSGNNHNYCRNPDNKKQPWCFTIPRAGTYISDGTTEWDYCDVPKC